MPLDAVGGFAAFALFLLAGTLHGSLHRFYWWLTVSPPDENPDRLSGEEWARGRSPKTRESGRNYY